MTYSKYIEANMCCFIPGKVIDEVLRLLRLVGNGDGNTTSEQFRAREILQELRDITSMAIEHFDEKIAPDLKKVYQDNAKFQLKGNSFALFINAIRSGSSVSLSDSALLDASTSSTAPTVPAEEEAMPTTPRAVVGSPDTHGFIMAKMNARIKREIKTVQMKHMKLIRQQDAQISELRSQVAELKRRVEETDAKNREIHLNVNQISSQKPAAAVAEPFIRKSNIKPRTATIILKRRLEQFDKERAAATAAVVEERAGKEEEEEGARTEVGVGSKRPRRTNK